MAQVDTGELFFLIWKFLSGGGNACPDAARALEADAEKRGLLPARTDVHGNTHTTSFTLQNSLLPHVAADALPQLLKQLLRPQPTAGPAGPPAPGAQQGLQVAKSLVAQGKHGVLGVPEPSLPAWCRPPHTQASLPQQLLLRQLGQRPGSSSLGSSTSLLSKQVRHLATVRGHRQAVYCCTYDGTGRRIFTGSDDWLVKIWSAETGQLLKTLRGHEAEITDLAISCDNQLLASSCNLKTIRIWSLQEDRLGWPISVLLGHTNVVSFLDFHPWMPDILLSSCCDGTCCIWNARDAGAAPVVLRVGPVFGPLSDRTRGGGQGMPSRLADAAAIQAAGRGAASSQQGSQAASQAAPATELSLICCAFSPDGSYIFAGGNDCTAYVWHWDVQQPGVQEAAPKGRRTQGMDQIGIKATTPSEESEDGNGGGEEGSPMEEDPPAAAAGAAPAAAPPAESQRLRRTRSASVPPGGQGTAAAAGGGSGPAGSAAAPAAAQGAAVLAGRPRPQELLKLTGHRNDIVFIEFSHEGHSVATASRDGCVKIWQHERKRGRYLPLWREALSLACPPDEEQLRKAMRSRKPPPHPAITQVVWNNDDSRIIAAVTDHSLRVWESHGGVQQHILRQHTSQAHVLAAHPSDPRLVMSAGYDGLTVLWDIMSGVSLKTFSSQDTFPGRGRWTDPLQLVDGHWSPDGSQVALTDAAGQLHVYGLQSSCAGEAIVRAPYDQFLSSDYAGLVRDLRQWVIDQESQQPPHLMTGQSLCDYTLHAYPLEVQLAYAAGRFSTLPRPHPVDKDHPLPSALAVYPPTLAAASWAAIEAGSSEAAMQQAVDRAFDRHREAMAALDREPERAEEGAREHHATIRRPGAPGQAGARTNAAATRQARAAAASAARQAQRAAGRAAPTAASTYGGGAYGGAPGEGDSSAPGSSDEDSSSSSSGSEDESDADVVLLGSDEEGEEGGEGGARSRAGMTLRPANRLRRSRAFGEEEEETAVGRRGGAERRATGSRRSERLTGVKRARYVDGEASEGLGDEDEDEEGDRRLRRSERAERRAERVAAREQRRSLKRQKKKRGRAARSEMQGAGGRGRHTAGRHNKGGNRSRRPRAEECYAWLQATEHRPDFYVPQLGDVVVYISQGHNEYLDHIEDKRTTRPSRRLPRMRVAEPCYITELGYEFADNGSMYTVAHLRLLVDPACTSPEAGRSFVVELPSPLCNHAEFVVPRGRFELAARKAWRIGDRCRTFQMGSGGAAGRWWDGMIAEDKLVPGSARSAPPAVGDPYRTAGLWERYGVRWGGYAAMEAGNTELTHLSPWELMDARSDWSDLLRAANQLERTAAQHSARVVADGPSTSTGPTGGAAAAAATASLLESVAAGFGPDEAARVQAALDAVMEDEDFALFIEVPGPDEMYPGDDGSHAAYNSEVALPLSLTEIEKRLENGFYHSMAAVRHDVDTIVGNAELFNGPESEYTHLAHCLRVAFCAVLEGRSSHEALLFGEAPVPRRRRAGAGAADLAAAGAGPSQQHVTQGQQGAGSSMDAGAPAPRRRPGQEHLARLASFAAFMQEPEVADSGGDGPGPGHGLQQQQRQEAVTGRPSRSRQRSADDDGGDLHPGSSADGSGGAHLCAHGDAEGEEARRAGGMVLRHRPAGAPSAAALLAGIGRDGSGGTLSVHSTGVETRRRRGTTPPPPVHQSPAVGSGRPPLPINMAGASGRPSTRHGGSGGGGSGGGSSSQDSLLAGPGPTASRRPSAADAAAALFHVEHQQQQQQQQAPPSGLRRSTRHSPNSFDNATAGAAALEQTWAGAGPHQHHPQLRMPVQQLQQYQLPQQQQQQPRLLIRLPSYLGGPLVVEPAPAPPVYGHGGQGYGNLLSASGNNLGASGMLAPFPHAHVHGLQQHAPPPGSARAPGGPSAGALAAAPGGGMRIRLTGLPHGSGSPNPSIPRASPGGGGSEGGGVSHSGARGSAPTCGPAPATAAVPAGAEAGEAASTGGNPTGRIRISLRAGLRQQPRPTQRLDEDGP